MPPEDDKMLTTIADGIRHAIRDHGVIDKNLTGSAAKRIYSRLRGTQHDGHKVRADIEKWFFEGSVQCEIDENNGTVTPCPYTVDEKQHWWTRGYAYNFRIFRALKAEHELRELKKKYGE